MKDSFGPGLLGLFFLAAFVTVIVYALVGDGDVEAPRRALAGAGFTEAVIEDGSFVALGCANEEVLYRATAKNPRGDRVNLIVCCGFLKACTVRFP